MEAQAHGVYACMFSVIMCVHEEGKSPGKGMRRVYRTPVPKQMYENVVVCECIQEYMFFWDAHIALSTFCFGSSHGYVWSVYMFQGIVNIVMTDGYVRCSDWMLP